MKKPPPPKDWSLDIVGKRFRVRWSKMEKDYGLCEAPKCLITVDPTHHSEQQKDTLLHEVLHALDTETHSGLREKQVRRMATVLLHFLRANPEVTRWLCEPDEG